MGKSNFPRDVEEREDLSWSGTSSAGLTALDQEREASLADEGGRSGAVMESQDESLVRHGDDRGGLTSSDGRRGLGFVLVAAAVLGLAVLLIRPPAADAYGSLPPS